MSPRRVIAAALALALAASEARAQTEPAAPTPTAQGSVEGRVSAPDASGGRPWIVYIEHAPPGVAPVAPNAAHPKLAQHDQEFAPKAMVVVRGQVIDFPNLDVFFHNVFSLSPGNEFDLGVYRAGANRAWEMRRPGEVKVYCNIHPNMAAKILVLENSLYAEVAADGTYAIRGVPPGAYTLVAWSADLEPEKRAITVAGGAAARADFALRPRERETHLNKYGKPYDREK